jgi:hypothetical protein
MAGYLLSNFYPAHFLHVGAPVEEHKLHTNAGVKADSNGK